MMKNIALSRPATSAIAAFLVLSTPAAFAQEAPTITMTPPVAAPTPQTPPTVPETTPAPVAAPQTAQPPATQPPAPKPVIRVPLEIEPAEAAPAPKAAERAEPAQPKSERAAPRARAAAAPAASDPAPEAPPADAAPVEAIAPVAAPMTAAAEPAAEVAAPPPVETANAGGSDFPWELAGGAALLIVGGAGLAFARRRRNERALADPAFDDEPAIATTPVIAEANPVESQAWVTPAYAPRERVEAPRTTPAFAAAPSGSMGRHEAMALAGPTPDNPFATLSKRLKRARFLDRQERVAYDETLGQQQDMTRKPVSAWEIAQRPAASAAQEQDVRRPEPGRGRPGLRPGFARN